jgi:hypothetical protein
VWAAPGHPLELLGNRPSRQKAARIETPPELPEKPLEWLKRHPNCQKAARMVETPPKLQKNRSNP